MPSPTVVIPEIKVVVTPLTSKDVADIGPTLIEVAVTIPTSILGDV